MLSSISELNKEGLPFIRFKEEIREVLSNPEKFNALKEYFNENRVNGSYDFGSLDCNNEFCRTAAIINYISLNSEKSDKGLFSNRNTDVSIQCMLNAFHKQTINAASIEFINSIDDQDTFVIAIDEGGCSEIKNERIEDLGLGDLVVVSKLS